MTTSLFSLSQGTNAFSQHQQELILLQDEDDNDADNVDTDQFDYVSNGTDEVHAQESMEASQYKYEYGYSQSQSQPQPQQVYYNDDDDIVSDDDDDDDNDDGHQYEYEEDEIVYVEEERSPFLLWNTMQKMNDTSPSRTTHSHEVPNMNENEEVVEVSYRSATEVMRRSIHTNHRKRKGLSMSDIDVPASAVSRYQNFFTLEDNKSTDNNDNAFETVINECLNGVDYAEDSCVNKEVFNDNDSEQNESQTKYASQQSSIQSEGPAQSKTRDIPSSIIQHRIPNTSRSLQKKNAYIRPPSPINHSVILQQVMKLKKSVTVKEKGRKKTDVLHPDFCFDKHRHKQVRVKKSKSIVGTRPSHWKNNKKSKKPPPQVQRALLAKATKLQSSRLSAHPTQHSQAFTPKHSSTLSQSDSATPKWKEDVDVRSMSFKLPFQRKAYSDETPGIDNVSKNDANNPSTNEQSSNEVTPQKSSSSKIECTLRCTGFKNSPRRALGSRKRKITGVLTGQLRNIRGMVDASCSRLQSGSYPLSGYNKRKGDVNDPRNRAKNYADVTVLEIISQSGLESHVICLSYVHQIVAAAKDSDISSSRNEFGSSQFQKGFLWTYFHPDTVRYCSIQANTQLRVYDSVFVTLNDGDEGTNHQILGYLLCTQLCENYPSYLAPYAKVPSFS